MACSQAFGAKAYHEVGKVSQRALLVLWTACVPITALWWFSEPVLLALGQAPEVKASFQLPHCCSMCM